MSLLEVNYFLIIYSLKSLDTYYTIMNIGELECRDLPLASYWVLQFEHVCKSLWRCGVHFEHRSVALQDLPKGSERVSKDIHESVQTKLPKRVLKYSEIIWRFINTLRSRLCNKKYSVLSLCLHGSVVDLISVRPPPTEGHGSGCVAFPQLYARELLIPGSRRRRSVASYIQLHA